MRTESSMAVGKPGPSSGTLILIAATFIVAVSSIVLVEPAPVDLLLMVIMPAALALGMRIPKALILPGLIAGVYVIGNLTAIGFSHDFTSSVGFTIVTLFVLASSFFLPA